MGEPPFLEEQQRRALDRLSRIPALSGFYLAGGTAIGQHLGHRVSRDLDLFSERGDVDLDSVREGVRADLPDAQVLSLTPASLRLLVDGTPVDIVRYPYPPLSPPRPGPSGVPVAQVEDLAAMKLAAIARRGIRRDFWDLYALCTSRLTLADAVRAYQQRFGAAEADVYHVLRALTWFDDAEKEPVMPSGMDEGLWRAVKGFFAREAPRLLEG